jgi:hypothetical protein
MSSSLPAATVLDRVYLEVRCKLLDIAACLDRVDRAEGAGSVGTDPRLAQIAKGIGILAENADDRAERIQMLFSDDYIANWNRREKTASNGTGRH